MHVLLIHSLSTNGTNITNLLMKMQVLVQNYTKKLSTSASNLLLSTGAGYTNVLKLGR